jgi:hypothetical protein
MNPTIWYAKRKSVLKFQASSMSNCWENGDESLLRTGRHTDRHTSEHGYKKFRVGVKTRESRVTRTTNIFYLALFSFEFFCSVKWIGCDSETDFRSLNYNMSSEIHRQWRIFILWVHQCTYNIINTPNNGGSSTADVHFIASSRLVSVRAPLNQRTGSTEWQQIFS